jgi:hypothetical protein
VELQRKVLNVKVEQKIQVDCVITIEKINMKNINKSTGYLIVIIFWLMTTLMLSSCALQKGGGCGGNPFQEGY